MAVVSSSNSASSLPNQFLSFDPRRRAGPVLALVSLISFVAYARVISVPSAVLHLISVPLIAFQRRGYLTACIYTAIYMLAYILYWIFIGAKDYTSNTERVAVTLQLLLVIWSAGVSVWLWRESGSPHESLDSAELGICSFPWLAGASAHSPAAHHRDDSSDASLLLSAGNAPAN